ncbi:MAG: hypothetical protein ACOCQD_01220 [archaeon]
MYKINNNLINEQIKEFKNSSQNQQLEKIKEMKNELQESVKNKEDNEDPDNILYQNIDRANRFLDILEEKIQSNETNQKKNISRLFEVSAQLINAITTASSSIIGGQKDAAEYEYKLQLLEIKNKELEIKAALQDGGKGKGTTNNLIVTDRESIMDMIKDDKGGDDKKEDEKSKQKE